MESITLTINGAPVPVPAKRSAAWLAYLAFRLVIEVAKQPKGSRRAAFKRCALLFVALV